MPNDRDTKNIVTQYAYKAEVKKLRDKYDYEGTVASAAIAVFLAGLGYLIGLALGPVGQIITTATLAKLGIDASIKNDCTKLHNIYTKLYDEMTKTTNPVLYVKITQPMIYRSCEDGEGWLTNGMPTINKYYQD